MAAEAQFAPFLGYAQEVFIPRAVRVVAGGAFHASRTGDHVESALVGEELEGLRARVRRPVLGEQRRRARLVTAGTGRVEGGGTGKVSRRFGTWQNWQRSMPSVPRFPAPKKLCFD